MSSYVLVPGAGGAAWYWHRVVPLLQQAGHEALAVDLPGADERADLREYASLVIDAIGDGADVVLVAQSLGGFTAPVAAAKTHVRALVLVNAMIPVSGETPGAWWANTGWLAARTEAAERGGYGTEFDEVAYFLHDMPPEVAAAGAAHQRPEAGAVFGSVCEFGAWPSIPTRIVAGVDDRFFPVEFQRRLALERLGLEADVLPGGHLIALAHPVELANYLLGV